MPSMNDLCFQTEDADQSLVRMMRSEAALMNVQPISALTPGGTQVSRTREAAALEEMSSFGGRDPL